MLCLLITVLCCVGSKSSSHLRFDDDSSPISESADGNACCTGESGEVGADSIIDSIFLGLTPPEFPPVLRKFESLLLGYSATQENAWLELGLGGFNRPLLGDTVRAYILSLNSSQMKALAHCLDSTVSVEAPISHPKHGQGAFLKVSFNCGELKFIQGPPGCGKTRFGISLLHTYMHCLRVIKSTSSGDCDGLSVQKEPHRIMVSAASNKAVSVLVEEYLRSSRPFTNFRWKCLTAGLSRRSCHELEESSCGFTRQNVGCVDAVLIGVEEIVELDGATATENQDALSALRTSDGMRAAEEEHCRPLMDAISASSLISDACLPVCCLCAISAFCAPTTLADIYVYRYAQRASDSLVSVELGLRICRALCASGSGSQSAGALFAQVLLTLKTLFVYFCAIQAKLARNLGDMFAKVFKNTAFLAGQRLRSAMLGAEQALVECTRVSGTMLEPEWVTAVTALISEAAKYVSYLNDFLRNGKYETSVVDWVLFSADTIFCTLSTAGCGAVRRQVRSVDVLLVDEAGQASEGELVVPLQLRPLNLVLIGDPQQLPPTVLSTENARLGWSRSSMERLMRLLGAPFRLLDTQYRMHPRISSFPNGEFYGGRLVDSDLVKAPLRPLHSSGGGIDPTCATVQAMLRHSSVFRTPFLFLDVKGKEHGGARGGAVRSISNPTEAAFVVRICSKLCESIVQTATIAVGGGNCWESPGECFLPRIRILTFYSAQVKVLQAELRATVADISRVALKDIWQPCWSPCASTVWTASGVVKRIASWCHLCAPTRPCAWAF